MAQHHLDPSGNDSNSGSKQSPWFTLTHASNAAEPGDTIVVGDGTYNYGDNRQDLVTDGTEGNRITVRAADGARPQLVWSGDNTGWRTPTNEGLYINSDYWIIDGLTFRNSDTWGLHIHRAEHITVRNCAAYDCAGPGMGMAHGGDYFRFENCTAHHTGVQGTQSEDDGDGFICNSSGRLLNEAVFDRCTAYANTDDGIDALDSRGATIRFCRAWDNGRSGSSTDGAGQGIKTGGGQNDSGNHLIHNCLAWNNESDGIADNLAHRGNRFYNCTAWNNGAVDFRFNDQNLRSGEQHVVRNCLIYEDDGGQAVVRTADDTSNSWNLGITDPQFRSTDEADKENFLHLSDGSPCIDAGTDVGLDYYGTAPDLGGIEFNPEKSEPSEPTGPVLWYHDGSGWQPIV